MSIDRLIAAHLRLSAEALEAAHILLSIGNRFAAYQAEQSIEQIILALAQSESVPFGRSQHHQLETMRRALPAENRFVARLARLTWLEAYATAYRYPRTMGGLSDPPPTAQLADAISEARGLLDDVAAHFGVDLDANAKGPAIRVRPPR